MEQHVADAGKVDADLIQLGTSVVAIVMSRPPVGLTEPDPAFARMNWFGDEEERRGTVTPFLWTRTTVPGLTQQATSGFGMGPGNTYAMTVHPSPFELDGRSVYTLGALAELVDEALAMQVHEKMLERLVLLDRIRRRSFITSAVIKLVFYECSMVSALWAGFELRCFQLLSLRAWLPSFALSDNW